MEGCPHVAGEIIAALREMCARACMIQTMGWEHRLAGHSRSGRPLAEHAANR
jgi:hypothetical protein